MKADHNRRRAVRAGRVFGGLAWIAGCALMSAQSSPSPGSVAGKATTEIAVSRDLPVIETKAFEWTPASRQVKEGDKIAAIISDGQAWSVEKQTADAGSKQVAYPIYGWLKTPRGAVAVAPGVLRAKIDVKQGKTVESGYDIEAARALAADESIFVLLVGDSLMSLDAGEETTGSSAPVPRFAAFRSGMKMEDRAAAVDAWRTARQQAEDVDPPLVGVIGGILASPHGPVRANADCAAEAQKLAAAPEQSGGAAARVVRGSGESSLWQAKTQEDYSYYLRFYTNGTVIGTSSIATPDQLEKWFQAPFRDTGQYVISGSFIRFSLGSPEGVVDYSGTIKETSVELTACSHINNHKSTEHYELVR